MKSFSDVCYELIILSEKLLLPQNKHLINEFLIKISDLKKLFSNVDAEKVLVQKIQPRLVVPLLIHLKQVNSSDTKCEIIQTLTNVLSITTVNDISNFFDVYTVVFLQIYKPENAVSSCSFSEEIKSAVLKCGVNLIKSLKKDELNKLYTEESSMKMSIGVLLAIQIAASEKSHSLRLDALEFLLAITQYKKVDCHSELWGKIGNVFMLYLPGLIGPLQEIILRDETQPHKVTVKALSCWGHVLTLVMYDEVTEENKTDEELIKFWINLSKEVNSGCKETFDMTKALQQKKRTKDWLKAAAITLKPLIFRIADAKKHSNAKVRLELIRVMDSMLSNCIVNLKIALTPMIEVLVSSLEDENEEVKNSAELAILNFEKRCSDKQEKIFIDVIEENLQLLISKLPGLIHSGDEKVNSSALNILSGYLKILCKNDRFVSFISLSSNLKRLVTVLGMCFKLETYPEISQKEFSLSDDVTETSNWSKSWKRFRYFIDQSVVLKLEGICHLLAKHGDVEIILDYLFESFNNVHESRKEILLIMNEVLLASDNTPDNVVKQVLELYLNPENLYVPLEVDEEICFSLREAHNNILQVALLMEGLGKCATGVKSNFEKYLLQILYFVIEKMGSSYQIIRSSAREAAERISTACSLNGDVTKLIQCNVDYLTYHLITKLRRTQNNPGVFDVVTVLMKNSPVEALPNLEDIINNVLKSSFEKFDSPYTISYLRLFQTFVLCVNKWLKGIPSVKENQTATTEIDEIDLLIEHIYNKNKKPEENKDEIDMDTDETQTLNEEIEAEPEKKEPLPRHVTMTLNIARHCLHFLPSNDFSIKLIVLEILNESVIILTEYENELLPLVHEIWSPLVTRFEKISDLLIINRSFTLLCTLSDVSKDFIRSRTLKEVLPALRRFLIKTAEKSRLKDSGSGYYFTQEFKLQKELLNKLGKLAVDLKLLEKQLDCIVDCSIMYLSSVQPQTLQESCRKLFIHLKKYDPYCVWLRLHILRENPEYSKNIQLIHGGS